MARSRHEEDTAISRDASAREPAATPLRRTSSQRSGTRTAATCEAGFATIDGVPVNYTLKVSPRARVLRLVIRPTSGLEVVVPRGTGRRQIEQVLHEKARWITTTLARVEREAAAATPPELRDGVLLPFAGQQLRLAIRLGAPMGRFRAIVGEGTLTLTVADASQEVLRAALEAWYRREAPRVFAERLAICNAPFGFAYGRVSIKEQKTRWGSCSRKGNLNFNWRLLLAPLAVLDYVVTHELAHLKELNHSPRFWALVASACPTYAAHRRWLRQHGRTLRV